MVGGGKHPLGASAGHGVTVLSADSHLPLRKGTAAKRQQAVFLRFSTMGGETLMRGNQTRHSVPECQ